MHRDRIKTYIRLSKLNLHHHSLSYEDILNDSQELRKMNVETRNYVQTRLFRYTFGFNDIIHNRSNFYLESFFFINQIYSKTVIKYSPHIVLYRIIH